jgi:hypothetical protein
MLRGVGDIYYQSIQGTKKREPLVHIGVLAAGVRDSSVAVVEDGFIMGSAPTSITVLRWFYGRKSVSDDSRVEETVTSK